ncbi:MAG TPA: polysaccharide biosynthesis tyrosine autokinase [Thermodesulfobacteriota bacterium]|nr:polysaccharide biosynthesis tyrosine autokinase [Thermodesulfobacteriota bacterium]
MSKIYEALENAEKQKTAGSNRRIPFVLGPKPKEEKKTAPVPGSSPAPATRPTPPPAAKEEKKTSPAPEHAPVLGLREEKQISPVPEPKKGGWASAAGFSAPGPKEEKRTAPVLQPKGEKTERQPVVHPARTVSKPVRPDRAMSDHPLVSLFEPGSLGAEQFRKLRNQVLKPNLPDSPKTIMVTSATAGEGKTFVAANLAAGIAHDLHFHALLVDCDLRNPALSHWFGVQNGHGLSDYLVGKGNLSDLLMKTRMDKLMILTGGSSQEKPAELLGSKKMEALVHELKARYADRYIILDSTPLLVAAEPEVLARLVDGIVIVVRAGVTPRETIKQAIASLDPKKIMGFVLNDVEFKSSGLSSRYFGSDGYYTKYGYGKKEVEPRSKLGSISSFKKKPS